MVVAKPAIKGLIEKRSVMSQNFRFIKLWDLLQGCQKVLSSRLIMNSRWLWNLHQRHKFLRAEGSRDILKIRVLEMAFPGVFKRCF